MTADPDVSAIVVCWNGGQRVLDALRSIVAGAGDVLCETIVVDNGSSDGSPEAIAQEPGVTLIRNQTNRGFAAANNQGVAAARGRLLLFLNDDVEVQPGAIELLVARLDRDPRVVACAPRLTWPDGRTQESNRAPPGFTALLHRVRLLRWTGLFRARYQAYRRSFVADAGPVRCPAGAALLVRRDALAPPVWDEGYRFGLEDVDLGLRLESLGAVEQVPEAVVVHHGSLASEANTAFTYAGYELGYARHLAKHGAHARAYALLIALDQPLRLAIQTLRWLRGLLRGGEARRREAARWAAIASFLALGLPALWRASRRVDP